MVQNFGDMEKAGEETLWVNFSEGGYTVEEEDSVIGEHEGPLIGAIINIEENVGEYDSRMYTVAHQDYEKNLSFWGTGSINSQVDNVDLGAGDEIAILHTGETGESRNGEFDIYDVRYSQA